MSSAWQTADDVLADRLASEPGLIASINANWPAAKQSGFVDFVFQRARGAPRLTDKYVVLGFLDQFVKGEVACTRVEVGVTPSPDREIEENREKLSRLHRPYSARVERGLEIGPILPDGVISWDAPIRATAGDEDIQIEPTSVPLEIGTCDAGRTHWAINMGLGLARWPYGSTCILLFIPEFQTQRLPV